DGRILVSQSHQIDVLNPLQAPRVLASNPPPAAVVALPLGRLSVTFDRDMLADAQDPHSVVNPANYVLMGDHVGTVTIQSIQSAPATRTAVLTFEGPDSDTYHVRVLTEVASSERVALASSYVVSFQAVSDFSALVAIEVSRGRADALAGTVSYDVTL